MFVAFLNSLSISKNSDLYLNNYKTLRKKVTNEIEKSEMSQIDKLSDELRNNINGTTSTVDSKIHENRC